MVLFFVPKTSISKKLGRLDSYPTDNQALAPGTIKDLTVFFIKTNQANLSYLKQLLQPWKTNLLSITQRQKKRPAQWADPVS